MSGPRQARLEGFLAAAGWGDAARAPLAGDASNRRYLRLRRDGLTAVLMDAPPERGEDVRPFAAMTRWLRARDLSAPHLIAEDAAEGFLLLEDLGDALYARHMAHHPAEEPTLYAEAVRLLARLAEHPPADWLAPYDRAALDREAALFAEWWLPATAGLATADRAAELAHLVAEATRETEAARSATVLRDYHAENLLWLPGRAGLSRIGLLDYQDALAGHAAYDLVSLLEDARRDTAEALQDAMVALYLQERPGTDPAAFRRAYAALGAQRNLKIIGIFARLALRDGKPRYLSLIPRVWGHLMRDVAHPALGDLRHWLARHAPPPEAATLARLAAARPA